MLRHVRARHERHERYDHHDSGNFVGGGLMAALGIENDLSEDSVRPVGPVAFVTLRRYVTPDRSGRARRMMTSRTSSGRVGFGRTEGGATGFRVGMGIADWETAGSSGVARVVSGRTGSTDTTVIREESEAVSESWLTASG